MRIWSACPGFRMRGLRDVVPHADPKEWDEKARKLAEMFINNFKKFETNATGKALAEAGPKI